MRELYDKLELPEGTYDVVFDPEVGPMELREIGMAERMEYNHKEQFAYAAAQDEEDTKQLIFPVGKIKWDFVHNSCRSFMSHRRLPDLLIIAPPVPEPGHQYG